MSPEFPEPSILILGVASAAYLTTATAWLFGERAHGRLRMLFFGFTTVAIPLILYAVTIVGFFFPPLRYAIAWLMLFNGIALACPTLVVVARIAGERRRRALLGWLTDPRTRPELIANPETRAALKALFDELDPASRNALLVEFGATLSEPHATPVSRKPAPKLLRWLSERLRPLWTFLRGVKQ